MCSSLRRVSMRSILGAMLVALIALPAAAQTAVQQPTAPADANRAPQAREGQPQQNTTLRAPNNAQNQPGAPQANGQAANSQQAGNLDEQIAACMVLGNQEEVAIAQFAEQRAQHPEVKKFAQQMIEHHQQAVAKIEQAAPQVAGLQLAAAAAGNQPGADRNARDRTASGAEPQAVQLAKAVKQQCLELTEKELGALQGAEFDKAYMGHQVSAHVGMLAELRGSKDFAGAKLQPMIAEGEKMTETHLAEAKKIMQQIKDQGSQPLTTQRPATTRPVR